MSIPLKIQIREDCNIENIKNEMENEIISEIKKIKDNKIEIYPENITIDAQDLIIDIHGVNFSELNIRYYIQKMIKFSILYAEKEITKSRHIVDYLFYDDDLFFIVENNLIEEMVEQNNEEFFLVKDQFSYIINKKEKSILKRIINKPLKKQAMIIKNIIENEK